MPRSGCFRAALLLAVCLGRVRDLPAMQDDPATRAVVAAAAGPHAGELDGFPVPIPPALIARDSSGRTTVRPSRVTSAMRIDGTLDEAIYESLPAISDFVQNDPSRRCAVDRKDRGLDPLRSRQRVCDGALLGFSAEAAHCERDAS